MNLLCFYAEFFKIGLFSVGGGLATLPFLYDMAERGDWLTPEHIGNFLAIAQSSPGAIGVNMSAQAGFAAAGIPGAVLAPLGLVTPAIIIILAVSKVLDAFKKSSAAAAVFGGLRPAAAGLIAAAGFAVIARSLYAASVAGAWYTGILWKETALFAVLFVLIRRFRKHPALYIAAGGIAGMLLRL